TAERGASGVRTCGLRRDTIDRGDRETAEKTQAEFDSKALSPSEARGRVPMAKCDEGYRCEVCGRDVEAIADSDLYLRYVMGEVPLELLHRLPERHVRCNPALAQYIADPAFEPVGCAGPFAKAELDAESGRGE